MKVKLLIVFFFVFLCNTPVWTKNGVKAEKGKASYYANKFHNKKTASGVLYDKNAYTCAHRTLPFGTKILVRNLKNDKTVIVEVIDRGPQKKERIIDLSYIAAKDLDIVRHGIAHVEVSEYVETDNQETTTDPMLSENEDTRDLQKNDIDL